MNRLHRLATFIVLVAATYSVVAQMLDPLRHAATGPEFKVGETAFRILPNAVVINERQQTTTKILKKHDTFTMTHQYRLGPYRIYISDRPDQKIKLHRRGVYGSDVLPQSALSVAINQRSGALVLVKPQVQLFVKDINAVSELAKETGGKKVSASALSGRGVIGYDNILQAQKALLAIGKNRQVIDANLNIVQSIAQTN